MNQLCKKDNIKITASLINDIEDVKNNYAELPNIIKKATENLAANKKDMEDIMQTSQDTLTKKIRAFEKKYIETYLMDKTRVDDCH